MARISEEEIKAVRSRADIVDVIGHYIQVRRNGRSYKAVCPFHDDHDPSLSIAPDKQIYKCFVCGNGGNVFTFVQNYENISFPEAVGRVASMIGYQLSVQPDQQTKPKDPHKEALYRVLDETVRYTAYALGTQEAQTQKEYLEKRGLDEAVRETFQIGYNPLGNSVSRFLHAKGYDDKDIVGANVGRLSERGIEDVFAGRIMFPIHDMYGNPIGFSARTLDPQNSSKYINTNETDVFHKGDIVYNYHRAKMAARREGKVYLCEGVTDVIAFHRAGIENAVCTLGTSCTKSQIRVLKGMAARIVFCYDGDHAGQAATWKAGKLAQEAGCEISIVLNDTGRDPDEIIRAEGQEGLKHMLSRELTWMEFVLKYLTSVTNLNSYQEKRQMADRAMAEINQLQDDIDKAYFTDELAKITGFRLEFRAQQQRQKVQEPLHRLSVPDGLEEAENQILAMMMNSAKACTEFEDQLGYLTDELRQMTAMLIVDQVHSNGTADAAALVDAAETQEMRNLITGLIADERYVREYDEGVLSGAIRKVKMTLLRRQANTYKEQMNQTGSSEVVEMLWKKYCECVEQLRRYSDEENRNDNRS